MAEYGADVWAAVSAWAIFATTSSGWFAALGCFAYFRSQYHRAKAEVYREFADDFSRMNVEGLYRKPKDQKRATSKRLYMSLALCDPLVRDGLWDALHEADEHWERMFGDPPRGGPQ